MSKVFFISLIVLTSLFTCITFPSRGDGNPASIDLGYYRDTTKSLTLDEITLIGSHKFTQSSKGEINLGEEHSTIWLRIDITLKSVVSSDYIIELDDALLDYVDFYSQQGVTWQVTQTGFKRAFSDRYLDHRFFAFPINTKLKSQTIYLKIESEIPINFRISLKSSEQFYLENLEKEMAHGMFIGFMLLVVLTNLIFYFSVKDRSFLIYVGYMSFILIINLFLTGHINKYFFTETGGWQSNAFLIIYAVTLAFSLWFAYEFLDLKKERTLIKNIFKPFVIISFCLTSIFLFFGYTTVLSFFKILTLLVFPLVIYLGFKRYQRGHRPAIFYIAAYAIYLIFLAPVILMSFNIFERNILSLYGTELGIVFESTLLTVALGYRYYLERQKADADRKFILEENLNLQKQLHSKLEKQVNERTKELNEVLTQVNEQKEEIEQQKENIEEQNKRLEKMNESKSRFISILAHDVKGPINSLFSFSELLRNHIDNLSKEELISLGKKLGNHTKNLFSLLENLLQWSRAQTGIIDKNPVIIDIKEAIDENIELAQMVASPKNIAILFEQTTGTIYADKDMFNTVMRNLIANAVKFSHSGDKIIIKVEMRRNEAVFMVSDNGVGISPKAQEKLFDIASKHCTPGTKGENGTGLGLKLCREFVILNGGQIWVESKFNQGSTFYFTFPLATDTVEVSH